MRLKSTVLLLLLVLKAFSQIPVRLNLFKSEKISSSPIYSIIVSNDGVVHASSVDGNIIVFFPQPGATRKILSYPSNFNFIPSIFLSDKNLAVVYGENFDIYEAGSFKKIFSYISTIPFTLAFNTIIEYKTDRSLLYYDNNNRSFKHIGLISDRPLVISAIGEKKFAAVKFGLNKILLWDFSTGFFLKSVELPENVNYEIIASLLFSEKDEYLVLSAYNGKVYIYDANDLNLIAKFNARINSPWSIAINKNKTALIFINDDKKINFFQFKTLTLSVLGGPSDKLKSEVSCVSISPNSKFVALGDYSGFVHIFRSSFKRPQIMISRDSQLLTGDEITLTTTEDEIKIQGFILSDLELENLKVNDKNLIFSRTENLNLSPSAEHIYQFSTQIPLREMEGGNRPAKISITVSDIDDNSSQINILINKLLHPPEITLLTEPNFEVTPNGLIQVKSLDKRVSILCYIFADAPISEVLFNGERIIPEKVNPDSVLIPKPNRKYACKFLKKLDLTLLKIPQDTIRAVISAKDIFNNFSSKMIEFVFTPIEVKFPPAIQISSVNVLIEENSEPSEIITYVEIEGFIVSNSQLSALLIYDSIQVPFYYHSSDDKIYKNKFNLTINFNDIEQISNSKYITITAIDEQGGSTTKEIFIPSEFGYLLSQDFEKPIYPKILALFIGVSKYKLRALNHPPSSNGVKSLANAISKFTNIDRNNIYTLTDEKASTQNILNYMNEILSKSGENDFIIIFLSGYLISTKSSQEIYYLTSNSSLTEIEKNSLNMQNFLNLISSRTSNCKVMLILDVNPATNSIEKFFGSPNAPISYKNSIKILLEKAKNINYITIFTGISENQKSIYGKNFANHGLFTYSLLNALTGEADDNADGIISLNELIIFTSLKVRELSNNKQNCSVYYNFNLDIPLLSMRKKSQETPIESGKTLLKEENEQNSFEREEQFFVAVEEMPEIIGGIESIQRNIVYPEGAIRAGIEGTVYVMAYVDENGNVVKADVLKGIGAGCNEASVAAVMKAKFKPGRHRGKPVKVRVIIPIRFELEKHK